jgi:hypothetical protein
MVWRSGIAARQLDSGERRGHDDRSGTSGAADRLQSSFLDKCESLGAARSRCARFEAISIS